MSGEKLQLYNVDSDIIKNMKSQAPLIDMNHKEIWEAAGRLFLSQVCNVHLPVSAKVASEELSQAS